MTQIIGEARVYAAFGNVAKGAAVRMRQTMETIGAVLESYVKRNKLSGDPLHRRSGTLSRSITHRTTTPDGAINAVVGTNIGYARAHEFGFSGTVTVRAHERMQTMVFGHPMAPMQVHVRSHPMRMNLPERSFLRSSLNETRERNIGRIRKTMQELIASA